MNQKKHIWASSFRITQWRGKLLLTAAYLCLLLVLRHFELPCIFLSLFRIPCPGCGMSRAINAAVHLDFAGAFQYHPMFWSVPILYLYFLFDRGLFQNRKHNCIFLSLVAAGFVLQWLLKLAVFC